MAEMCYLEIAKYLKSNNQIMIIKKVTYLSDLHFDHNQWSSELLFWKKEIKFFENQLAEVVKKCTDNSVMAQVEHFQNIFMIQQEAIHTLKHSIRNHEKELAHRADVHPDEVEEKYFANHDELRDSMNTQRKLFRGMKKDFMIFLSMYL